jgi:hypothetical protein
MIVSLSRIGAGLVFMPRTKYLLTTAQEKELWRLSRFYWREAQRCDTAKGYLAGCAMLGSAIECALILFTNVYFDEAFKTQTATKKKLGTKPLLKWSLADLIDVAREANWLKSGLKLGSRFRNQKRDKIGDYVDLLRSVRNLIYPSRYAQDHRGKRVTKKYFDHCGEILGLARDCLEEKIHADLWPILMPGIPRGSRA